MSSKQATPAMRQFHEIKRGHEDAILFFRMGDFYEMFYDDALTASRELELTLTSRQKDPTGAAIPMCGIPYHAADNYIGKLIRRGFKVAVCDQVEDARNAKGIVKREVVRVVTPSTYLSQSYLEDSEPSYLMAIALEEQRLGCALVDLSTGDFIATEHEGEDCWETLSETLATYRPRELLVSEDAPLPESVFLDMGNQAERPIVTTRENWRFDREAARERLLRQFQSLSLAGYGLEDHPLAVAAAGAALHYLEETQKGELRHIAEIRYLEQADYLVLDPVTQRNLELFRSLSEGGRQGSLVGVIDETATAMGSRLLKAWLSRPLLDIERIADRLDAVEEIAFDTVTRGKLRETLKSLVDIERVLSRITLHSASPRDYVALNESLDRLPAIVGLLRDVRCRLLVDRRDQIDILEDVRRDIDSQLVLEPPASLKDGGVIRDGVSAALDELRGLRRDGKSTLTKIEARERDRTGISTLKVRFNRVFGYYIEVTKSKLDAVPEDYIRKQTLVGSERFITPELKEYEEKILGAEEKLLVLETELFDALQQRVAHEAARIHRTAESIATLDVLAGLAELATIRNYTKPRLHPGFQLELKDARHPTIEANSTEPFVPNDLRLDDDGFLMILTGPNMGGKSTFLRQTALINLMAQMGSFVPASDAKLPVVDRIFTRVGASDNLFRGRSTFMIEMQETAHILHHATRNSLVLLDEIGRGTSTYDGLSIAWAVAEYIAKTERIRAKTIFATHYHELTDLAAELTGVVNFHVSAREWQDDVVFLRKVIEGGSDRSYGIQVGKLAGLPRSLISRAQQILSNLERAELDAEGRARLSVDGNVSESSERQLNLFVQAEDQIAAELRRVDLEAMTPLEAIQFLGELKGKLKS